MIIPTVLVLLLAPFAGNLAGRRGRSYWLWFSLCLVLPIVAHIFLMNLPNLSALKKKPLSIAEENEELFDHLFITKKKREKLSAQLYDTMTA